MNGTYDLGFVRYYFLSNFDIYFLSVRLKLTLVIRNSVRWRHANSRLRFA